MGGDTLEENSYARLEYFDLWTGNSWLPHTLLWMKNPKLGVMILRNIDAAYEAKTSG
jgi:hypothetical protein